MRKTSLDYLKELYRQNYISNWCPITDILPDNKTCVTKHGTILQILKLEGKDYSALSWSERERLFTVRKTFFEKIEDNLEVSIFACRRKYEEQQIQPDFENEYAQEISNILAEKFRTSYKTEIYIVVKSPLKNIASVSGIGTKDFSKEEAALMGRADSLSSKVDVLKNTLDFFNPKVLAHSDEHSELHAFWSYLLNGGVQNEHTSENVQALNGVLGYSDIEFIPREPTSLYKKIKKSFEAYSADNNLYQTVISEISSEISKGNNAYISFSGLEDTRFASILFLKHYPQVSEDKLFDGLLSIQKEFILVQHFTPVNKEVALEKAQLRINQLQSFGRFVNKHLVDTVDFADGLAADEYNQINHSMSLITFGSSTEEVDETVGSIVSALGSRGINVKREAGFTEAAYWSIFPDYEELSFPRRVPITTITAADFCTFGAKPFGNNKCSFGDYPVSYFKTEDGQNFAFTFHPSPEKYVAGHTLIVGGTGAGKTLSTAFMISQCLKFRGHGNEGKFKTLIFDSLNGLKVPTKAFGGDYIDINDKDGFIPLNPLQLPDSATNRAFLEKWIASLCKHVDERDEEAIQRAVRTSFETLAPEERSLNAVRMVFGVEGYREDKTASLAKQLAAWMPDKENPEHSDTVYGNFFNAPVDALSFQKQLVGFDLTFLKEEPKLLAPLTSYLFHAFTDYIYRKPCPHMWFIDEAFNFIQNPIIYPHIRTALKEWRKRNGLVIAAIQDLETLNAINVGQEFLQSFQTYILFKDPTASPENYLGKEGRAGVGLNENEFNWIKSYSGGKREIMVKRKTGESIILDIDLSNLGKHINLLRSEKAVLDAYANFKDQPNWQKLLMNSF